LLCSSGCGGLPLVSRYGCCSVVRRPGLDERLMALSLATGLVFAPPSPRLSHCFLCLRCTSTRGLGSLACCGGRRLRRRSTPFSLGFLGRLLLRDRGSVVPVFVGLSLAFVAAYAVEADGVFMYRLNYYGWLVSYHSRKTTLRGGRRCFSGRRGYYTEFL